VRLRRFGLSRIGHPSRMGTAEAALERRLPAVAESLAVARSALRDFTADLELDVAGIELAVSEAVADAVVHDGGSIDLSARSAPLALEVTVRDDRPGAAPPTPERLALIRLLAHHVGIDDGRRGHALTLRFRRLVG
jgi:anti-sigma regulatory factor (Ser/Thr protein kinase)